MAQNLTRNVEQEYSVVGTSGATGNDALSPRTTAMFSNAHNFQIANSTLSVAGRDHVVHNHYSQYERSRDIWAILQSIPNFRRIYHDMLSKATAGTGMWLVKGDKFRIWLEPNGNIKIFWGSGIPGAGKTLLASIVIEHLEAIRKESIAAICVCYVYFRYSDRSEMTVRNVLEILVKQTLERHPECAPLIEQTYAQHIREGSEPTEAQLLGLLRELADHMACTFYVLDALDEAPTKIQLAVVETLASLDVKLFITSRPLKAVEENFPEAYSLRIAAQDDNIDLHITKVMNQSADLRSLLRKEDPSLREEIISTIKQNCGGMFLHAALQLVSLTECLNARDVRDTLAAFPSTIEDVYHHTWARIASQSHKQASLAKFVLAWVLNASRSMTIEELERAVATSPTTHKFELDRLVPRTTLMSLCRGLITVDEESRLVRLVHYTAEDTLEGLLREAFPHPHSLLAAICMTHLIKCGFQNTTVGSWQEFEIALENDPLLAYASEAWAFHALSGLDEEKTKCHLIQFVSESNAFPAFLRLQFDILTPLHLAGLYHLPLTLFSHTIEGSQNITTTIRRQSPLMVASWSGHEDLVARLISLSDTQVNLVDTKGYSALMLAAREGRKGVVELLLAQTKVQVNLVNDDGCSALTLAAQAGHEVVVKLPLAHAKIQVNLVDILGEPALIVAAREGHAGVVMLLLAYPGIRINLVTYYYDELSALMVAAREGRESVIKHLLAHADLDVNLVNNRGESALMLGARRGHEGVTKHLLAHGNIQVNLADDHGSTALHLAACNGHKTVVEHLLMADNIDVNAFDKNGDTALTTAAQRGHEVVVRMFLDILNVGTTIRTRFRSTTDGRGAMSAAQASGHNGIVEPLHESESQKGSVASHRGISPLSVPDGAPEDGSDSDSPESYFDAEEDLGEGDD